jgi:hypothetical protein
MGSATGAAHPSADTQHHAGFTGAAVAAGLAGRLPLADLNQAMRWCRRATEMSASVSSACAGRHFRAHIWPVAACLFIYCCKIDINYGILNKTNLTLGRFMGYRIDLPTWWTRRGQDGPLSGWPIGPVSLLQDKARAAQHRHPDWFAVSDYLCLDTCHRQDLHRLLRSAPCGFSTGMVYSKLTFRLARDLAHRGPTDSGELVEIDDIVIGIQNHLALLEQSERVQQLFDKLDQVDPDYCSDRRHFDELIRTCPTSNDLLWGIVYAKAGFILVER